MKRAADGYCAVNADVHRFALDRGVADSSLTGSSLTTFDVTRSA